MSFPTTPVLDNFNRANEGPPPSASWGGVFISIIGLKVVSSQVTCDVLDQGNSYWGSSFAADQECYVTVVDFGSGSLAFATLFLRITNPSSTGLSLNAYYVDFNGTTDVFNIGKYVSGTGTNLVANQSLTLANGDSIGARVVGTTISVWHKPAAGSWAEVGSTTDSDVGGAGNVGLRFTLAAGTGDDFGGGAVVSGSTKVTTLLIAGR